MSNVIAQALREYGQAIRGDCSLLDGRGVRNQLNRLADALDNGDTHSIAHWRRDLEICPDGGGHWSGSWFGYCETPDGCPSLREAS